MRMLNGQRDNGNEPLTTAMKNGIIGPTAMPRNELSKARAASVSVCRLGHGIKMRRQRPTN